MKSWQGLYYLKSLEERGRSPPMSETIVGNNSGKVAVHAII
jgi:hypothetical protein